MLAIGKMKPEASASAGTTRARHLKRDLLRLRHARDEQAEAKHRQDGRDGAQQHQPRPAHRQTKQHHRDEQGWQTLMPGR